MIVAGPVEATAIGNVMVQAIADGEVGDLEQAREIVRSSCDIVTYEPTGERQRWLEAAQRLEDLGT